jgi:anti-repressor protein
MHHLFNITRHHGKKVVSAREIHAKLESKQDFSDWIKARIQKYGFQENKDFTIILGKSNGGRPTTEYAVTLDMAKELGMVEGNDIMKRQQR